MGGPYGTGTRIDLPVTRKIINAILNDSILNCEYRKIPVFRLSIPTHIDGIDDDILDPGSTWESPARWKIAATDLGMKFINNFTKFSANKESAMLAGHGPVTD
jgi:phosphoenolpyruvate carboxykinase (ATP)